MKTDIEIAHSTELKRIDEVATQMGIDPENIEHYGKHIAKLPLSLIDKKRQGKLILVTAITATRAGIGKTTVSLGLALGLKAIGKNGGVAVRAPSRGPCFG
uniref:formate--tetrahydrofolate ligase n=1 Tax=Alloprevotella sp. TaxID=1872471 RepID=UPI004027964C